MRARVLAFALALACAGSIGCVSEMQCGPSADPTERQRCVGTGGPAEAVGTAAAAGVAWGAVGCRQNGCNPGWTCDQESGACERMRCSEGHPCPPAFECDFTTGRCE